MLHGQALKATPESIAGCTRTLAQALARNVWRGAAVSPAAERLAGIAMRQHEALAGQRLADMLRGQVGLLPAEAVPV